MSGRRWYSRQASSVSLGVKSGRRRKLYVFTPMILPAKSFSTYWLIPSTIETTAMRNITPIMTPSSVKKLFSFWTRIVSSARRMASRKGTPSVRQGSGVGFGVMAEGRRRMAE